MKYPSINKQPRREINIPELAGGANYRDSISNVLDNQLTDCLNVWWQDGALRTRPSFKTNTEMSILQNRITDEYLGGSKAFPEITRDGKTLVGLSKRAGTKGDGGDWTYDVDFFWQDENSLIEAGGIWVLIPAFEWDGMESLLNAANVGFFVVEKSGVLYAFIHAGNNLKMYKSPLSNDKTAWTEIKESELYAPIVCTHCLPTNGGYDFTGVQYEGYNLLTGRYRMIYSTYNSAEAKGSTRFRLAQQIPLDQKCTIEAKVTLKSDNPEISNVTYTHTVEWRGSGLDQTYLEEQRDKDQDYGLHMFVNKCYVMFSSVQGSCVLNDFFKEENSLEDNLEITVYCDLAKKKKKVCGMTQAVWFGGSANGISDGSRLFLCGNTDENEQALVVWSGLNDPTYFSENCYAYIGSTAKPTVAFGKQDDKLVIFKPNDTYYTYYAQNTEITADDLINQTVVDYQANSVYFPMVQLNGSIGCDLPDTVQLCRNRLVWANSNGKVYTLVSTNQYSEQSIYEVSAMVERKIKESNYTAVQFAAAQSCDFAGHYVLIIGQDAYVMDYNSYGYQYVHSYTKTEDAQIKIPWYRWKFQDIQGMFLMGDKIAAAWWEWCDMGGVVVTAVLNSDDISGDDEISKVYTHTGKCYKKTTPIKSSLTTKLFDFGAPHYRKNVDRVSISFGNNGGTPITVRFVTDVGTEEESVSLSGDELTAYTPAYVTVKQFNPCIRAHTRFGIQIECDGLLAVDAVNLLYRLLGGVR